MQQQLRWIARARGVWEPRGLPPDAHCTWLAASQRPANRWQLRRHQQQPARWYLQQVSPCSCSSLKHFIRCGLSVPPHKAASTCVRAAAAVMHTESRTTAVPWAAATRMGDSGPALTRPTSMAILRWSRVSCRAHGMVELCTRGVAYCTACGAHHCRADCWDCLHVSLLPVVNSFPGGCE